MVFTVGHSTLSQAQFLELIAGDAIRLLWDVRSYPASRWEWFRRDRLELWLPEAGVEYVWAPALGGRRRPPRSGAAPRASDPRPSPLGSGPRDLAPGETSQEAPAGPGHGWREEGFANYQWHMAGEEFLKAADELVRLGRRRPVGIMCAEGVWWRCHRSMIADYLVTAGAQVVHLQPRRLDHAAVLAERLPRYHPDVIAAWRRHLGW